MINIGIKSVYLERARYEIFCGDTLKIVHYMREMLQIDFIEKNLVHNELLQLKKEW